MPGPKEKEGQTTNKLTRTQQPCDQSEARLEEAGYVICIAMSLAYLLRFVCCHVVLHQLIEVTQAKAQLQIAGFEAMQVTLHQGLLVVRRSLFQELQDRCGYARRRDNDG